MSIRESEETARVHLILFKADLEEISQRFPALDRSVVVRRMVRQQLKHLREKALEKARPVTVQVDVGDLVEREEW